MRRRWTLWGLVVLGLLLSPGQAVAGKPTRNASDLVLSYEARSGYPPWECYHEDSFHTRLWIGDLPPGGRFVVALPFCTFEQYPSGPGGTGFLMAVVGRGDLLLWAVAPSGTVSPAHLVARDRSRLALRRCVVQPVFDATLQVGVGTIEPGRWTVVLENRGERPARDLTLQVEVNQAVSAWQEAVCPSQDWNFTP